jgi:uncharacterized protein YchJ
VLDIHRGVSLDGCCRSFKLGTLTVHVCSQVLMTDRSAAFCVHEKPLVSRPWNDESAAGEIALGVSGGLGGEPEKISKIFGQPLRSFA